MHPFLGTKSKSRMVHRPSSPWPKPVGAPGRQPLVTFTSLLSLSVSQWRGPQPGAGLPSAAHSVVTTRTLVHPGRTEAHLPDPGAQLGACQDTHSLVTARRQEPGQRDNFHYLLTFINTQQVKVKWILLAVYLTLAPGHFYVDIKEEIIQ